jgi:hypothetical protein
MLAWGKRSEARPNRLYVEALQGLGWRVFFMRRVVFRALAMLMAIAIGCDKRPQSDASTSSNQADGATETPTPQVPVAAQQNFPLMVVPLTMSIPAGWKLDPPVAPSFLEGPAPSGNLEISLSLMDSMDDRRRKLFIDGALDEHKKHPLRIQVQQLTTKSGLQVFERITYARLPGNPATQPAATLPSRQLSWNIVIFVPYQHKIMPCSFDLLGVTQQEYEQDQQMVSSMIDTARPGKTPGFQ